MLETKRPVIGCGRRTDRSALEFGLYLPKTFGFTVLNFFSQILPPCAARLLTMVFLGVFFLGSVKRPYVQRRVKEDSIKPEALITGQTEGLKGGFKEWVGV